MGNPLLPNLPALPNVSGFENTSSVTSDIADALGSPQQSAPLKPATPFSTGSSILDSVIGGVLNATGLGTPTNNPNVASGGFLDRAVAIVLGLILITAGLFLFKPVSENITRVARGAIV